MKHYIFLFFLLAIIGWHCKQNQFIAAPEPEPRQLELRDPFWMVEGTDQVIISPQPTEEQLHFLLSQGVIQQVIRLNGNGKDAGAITSDTEALICRDYRVEFHHLNAHEGYQEGAGYQGSAAQIGTLLDQGRVLIHCRHGMHRARSMVGAWLRKQGVPYPEVIRKIMWQDLVEMSGPYYKYVETVW